MPELDSKKAEVTVWLLKLPPYIAERIKIQSNGTELGQINITKSSLEITFDSFVTKNLPMNYEVAAKKVAAPTYILTAGGSYSLDGKVSKECIVSPILDDSYFTYRRKMQATQRTTIIDHLESRRGDKISFSEMDLLSKKRKKMLQDRKRERLDRQVVMDMIFRAFEAEENWTAKDLADYTGQPIAYITELMQEVGYINKKDHRNAWCLRDEYIPQKK